MSKSVAFKCTYNNGDEGHLVGFAGTCSNPNIYRNVKDGRVWCSDGKCECRKFFDREMKGRRPTRPCAESKLFVDWKFDAGGYRHGNKKDQSIPLRQAGVGNFAVLTTRFPSDPEEDRNIIGLFRIAKVEDNSVASQSGGIRLPIEEAKKLYFWAYSNNAANRPVWKEGLFRYLDDGQVHRILVDVAATVRDEVAKKQIEALIQQAFKGKEAPSATGCLRERSTERGAAIAVIRKYGSGGEGKYHKELKEWIADHPEAIGISDVVKAKVEHPFQCYDSADIVFTHASGANTVIEIETDTPCPGEFQVVKYRALLCAEKGLPLGSKDVVGMLVAWSIPSEIRAFCDKYGILWREYKLLKKAKS